jgi:hypothetical protein
VPYDLGVNVDLERKIGAFGVSLVGLTLQNDRLESHTYLVRGQPYSVRRAHRDDHILKKFDEPRIFEVFRRDFRANLSQRRMADLDDGQPTHASEPGLSSFFPRRDHEKAVPAMADRTKPIVAKRNNAPAMAPLVCDEAGSPKQTEQAKKKRFTVWRFWIFL